jgi:hypothetical protein
MQNALGTFNDLAVQQDFLGSYVGEKVKSGSDAYDLILAVGSLLGILHHRQRLVRDKLGKHSAAFADPRTKELVTAFTEQRSCAA